METTAANSVNSAANKLKKEAKYYRMSNKPLGDEIGMAEVDYKQREESSKIREFL